MWDAWTMFFAGAFVGVILGVLGMGLLVISRDTAYEEAKMFQQMVEHRQRNRNGLQL